MAFQEMDLSAWQCNPFDQISKKWYLITAGDKTHYNTMTASWGMMGVFWGKPVVHSFVRHSRYTFSFMEEQDYFTVSFFEENYRPQLQLCGSKSGRDIDKTEACHFTPVELDGAVSFAEASLVLVCRKMYAHDITPNEMLDQDIMRWYEDNDFHRCYVGEIVKIYQNVEK